MVLQFQDVRSSIESARRVGGLPQLLRCIVEANHFERQMRAVQELTMTVDEQVEWMRTNRPPIRVMFGTKTYDGTITDPNDGYALVCIYNTPDGYCCQFSWKSVARAYFGGRELRM